MGKQFHLRKKKYLNIELHLVGPLQSNKAKDAVSIFDCIQTVDREKIAKTLKQFKRKTTQLILKNNFFFNRENQQKFICNAVKGAKKQEITKNA